MNAAAALRPAAVVVELGDWEYEIPRLPAADWLEALLAGWFGVVPGLLHPEDEISVLRDYRRGDVAKADLLSSAKAAVEAAAGTRWWRVERLVSTATAEEFWPAISGELLRRVDVERASLGGALNE